MRKSKPQTPITVKLSCDEITEAVKWYYKELGKTDLALAAAIQAVRQDVSEPSSGSFLAEVCLVADWGSIALKTFSFESRLNMANEITNCWPQLKSLHLAGNGSEAELKLLSETHLLQPIGNPNQQLSFVSKYLHWCVNPGFAIWDHYSRVAMGQKDESATWASYKDWSGLIRESVAEHRECLLLQGSDARLARTLDKALYTIGRHLVYTSGVVKAFEEVKKATNDGYDTEIASALANGTEVLEYITSQIRNGQPQVESDVLNHYIREHETIQRNPSIRVKAQKARKDVANIAKQYPRLSRNLFAYLVNAGRISPSTVMLHR